MADRPSSTREQTASVAPQISGIVGVAFFFVLWFLVVQLRVITIGTPFDLFVFAVVYAMVVLSGLGLRILLLKRRRAFQARRAQRASAQVDEWLKDMQSAEPGKDVAAIEPQQVAAALKNTQVSEDQLIQLVEQRKQKMLIDDATFSRDVGIIVDYLRPLPRNAKRALNRFRLSLLIAERRGLFTTDPKVTKEQIGKWLVLGERWPQLRQSLSVTPWRMERLESAAAQRPTPGDDPFTDHIKLLAPFYAGDEDLRVFIQSPPALAVILSRLVHYGSRT